jgi:hypothetical protein
VGKSKKKRSVKALVVKAELTVQKVGTIQICAPLGVIVDSKTGELRTPVELKLLGQPVFTPTVVSCKLINNGLQKACLVVQKLCRSGCEFSVSSKVDLDIPIFGMHDIPHIQPGDQVQEKAEVELIDIRGIRDPNSKDCGEKVILIIKVIYKVDVTIAREETICIPEHCEGKGDDCCIQEEDFQDTIINKNDIKIIVNPFQRGSRRIT